MNSSQKDRTLSELGSYLMQTDDNRDKRREVIGRSIQKRAAENYARGKDSRVVLIQNLSIVEQTSPIMHQCSAENTTLTLPEQSVPYRDQDRATLATLASSRMACHTTVKPATGA